MSLDTVLKNAKKRKEPKYKTLGVSVSPSVHAAITKAAKRNNTTVSAFLTALLEAEVNHG